MPRRLAKDERQRLIQGVIARRRIGTQLELEEALARAGYTVTQATLSRDLRELGVEKLADPLGRPRYALPGRAERSEPGQALAAILGRHVHSVSAAQNLVVIRSELGTAPAIARALDRLEHPLVVGTLAGDDTCLVVARSSEDAAALAEELG